MPLLSAMVTRTIQARTTPWLLVLVASAELCSAPVSLETLVTNPPFGKGESIGTANVAEDNPWEFRGVLSEDGVMLFSVRDPFTRRPLWVGLNEPGNSFVVTRYDSVAGVITVEHQGRTFTVELQQSKVMALSDSPTISTTHNSPAPATATDFPNSPEAERLAQVAEKIRQRRASREHIRRPDTSAVPTKNP